MQKKGVLLVNLGSPDSTSVRDVRNYLDEFLMDERVVDLPYLFRVLLVKGIILNTRPKRSAKAYKKIWWDEGSPLIVLTKRLQNLVKKQVSVPVEIAMRYANPSIESGLEKLHNQGVDDVLIFPLYPQFAMATTETIWVLAEQIRDKKFPKMKLTQVPAFYHKKEYLEVLAQSIKEEFSQDYILFSYHGVPERHIRKTDKTGKHKGLKFKDDVYCCKPQTPESEFCYRTHCYETTRGVAEILGLKEGTYGTSFQSRLGLDPWLQPYTDDTIEALAHKGIKRLAVVTPAFVSDCLETLEEIGMEGKEEFLEAGGEEFKLIPCLNERQDWANVVVKWINDWVQ